MDRLQRIFGLHQILSSHRYPVAHAVIQEKLGCSRATINRIIQEMRLHLGAPIEYDRDKNGYYYARNGEHPYELPGLWFNASELYALLAMQQLIETAQPGLLESQLNPLKDRIQQILASEHLGSGEVIKRIRILPMSGRSVENALFQAVAGGLLQRKRLHIRYHGRGENTETERDISPQRLVHYRDNWYLDAFCHLRNGLRSFAVDRIRLVKSLEQSAKNIPESQLDTHFATSYGIFAGKPKHTAILRFTPERARWVADEQWHPQQKGKYLNDGSYELSIPYADPRELVMDILKYGADVEVVAPESLHDLLCERLTAALTRYGRKKRKAPRP